jgi:hypothetical protein
MTADITIPSEWATMVTGVLLTWIGGVLMFVYRRLMKLDRRMYRLELFFALKGKLPKDPDQEIPDSPEET